MILDLVNISPLPESVMSGSVKWGCWRNSVKHSRGQHSPFRSGVFFFPESMVELSVVCRRWSGAHHSAIFTRIPASGVLVNRVQETQWHAPPVSFPGTQKDISLLSSPSSLTTWPSRCGWTSSDLLQLRGFFHHPMGCNPPLLMRSESQPRGGERAALF